MKEIAIYVEGGGDTAQQKSELRQGFASLFNQIKSNAASKGWSLRFTCCGNRNQAHQDFIKAPKENHRINVLLVDSEEAIPSFDKCKDAWLRVEHLKKRDKWNFEKVNSEYVHLMVQCMETWIVADAEALKSFYRQGFLENCLPARDNLEEISKKDILNNLKKATKNTQKGEYGKIKHASKLLMIIDSREVEKCCPRFKEFTQWLDSIINRD